MPLLTLLRPRGTAGQPNVEPVGPASAPILIPSLRVRLYYWATATSTSPTIVDLSTRAREVSTQRGRSSRLSAAAEPGSMTIVLDNSDGYLDPENTSSALHGKLKPRGNRPTMLTVDHLFEGSYRPLGTGMLDSIDRQWGGGGARWSQTVITTVDQTADLASLIPPAGVVLKRDTAGNRINNFRSEPSRTGRRFVQRALIQDVSINRSARILGESVTDGSASLWDILTAAAFADDGLIYFSASGGLRFQSGSYRLNRPVTATLGDGASEITVESDLTYRLSSDDVVDEAAFTTSDGSWTAAQSELGFYTAPDSTGTATALADRSQVESRARYVWARDSVPRRAVESVTLNVLASYRDFSSASAYRFATGVSISDRIVLNRRPPGGGSILSAEYFVESISHAIDAGTSWTTTLRLSKATETVDFWDLGVSQLGSTTRLTW